MTHPATPEVGGEASAPAIDPFEAIADEMLGENAPQEEEEEEPAEEAGEEPAAEEEDESEPEIEADDIPPIDPPNSLTAEEKEAFKSLPREAQEFTARRIGELEKGFQAKAQEAAQAKQSATTEAARYIAQMQAEYAQQLDQYAQQFVVREPDPDLIAADPVQYAQQMRAYQYYSAQRARAQQDADKARLEAEQYQEVVRQHEAEAFRQRLSQDLPEFFDETSGPKLKEDLTATAKFLGFSDQEIFAANANQILALKRISDLKAKADKFDGLMKRQMERVRAGKSPPPIAKPGTRQGPEQNRKAKADAAWNAAVTAKTRNQREQALATWAETTGWLD